MSEFIYFQGSRSEAERLIQSLPAMLAGRVPDAFGLARGIQLRCGMVLLERVRMAFLVKSDGGTGDDGIKWPPLSPKTIARRKLPNEERKALNIRVQKKKYQRMGQRRSLTAEQNKEWKAIFNRVFLQNRLDMGDAAAKAKAGKIAWAVMKERGAKTLLQLLGSRDVKIGQDTGELLRCLSVGVDGRIPGGQVFRVGGGKVTVGNNKKVDFHRGNPKNKQPARLQWPADGHLPPPWEAAVNEQASIGLFEAMTAVLGGVH